MQQRVAREQLQPRAQRTPANQGGGGLQTAMQSFVGPRFVKVRFPTTIILALEKLPDWPTQSETQLSFWMSYFPPEGCWSGTHWRDMSGLWPLDMGAGMSPHFPAGANNVWPRAMLQMSGQHFMSYVGPVVYESSIDECATIRYMKYIQSGARP